MKLQTTPPTGHAQTFDVNETFFSTTDRRGVITAGNRVFCRTSGYAFEEMIGQPHNFIRHRAMPRQVFRLLWETIQAGKAFMGYVQNHARNGNHYWVFAIVLPVDQGYLSVRIKPTSPLLSQIEAVYRQLAEKEAEAIAAGRSESQAAEASRELLHAAVKALGFPHYDAFSHHALNVEIKARDAEVSRRALRLFPAAFPDTDSELGPRLRGLFGETLRVYDAINGLFDSLDRFVEVCRGMRERQQAFQRISEEFRLNAFNAHIAAHPLGAEGITLGTVAQILSGHGQTLAQNVRGLTDGLIRTTNAVEDVASNLSSARIQIEMLLTFLTEIGAGQHDRAEMHQLRAMTEDLRCGFRRTVEQAFRAIDTLQAGLPQVLGTKEQLRKDIIYLQVAQISGLTEVSRMRDAETLAATFVGLRAQIESGVRQLEELDRVVDELQILTAGTPPKVRSIDHAMRGMRDTWRVAEAT